VNKRHSTKYYICYKIQHLKPGKTQCVWFIKFPLTCKIWKSWGIFFLMLGGK